MNVVHLVRDGCAIWRLQCTPLPVPNDLAWQVHTTRFRRFLAGSDKPSLLPSVVILLCIPLWVGAFWLTGQTLAPSAWGVVAAAWVLARLGLSLRFRRAHPPDDQLRLWEARVRRLDILGGCIWGSVGLLAPSLVADHAPYLALGELMVVGSSSSQSILHRPAVVWMPVPCSVLTILLLMWPGDMRSVCIGLGFGVVAALLIHRALSGHQRISQTMLAAEERLLLLQEQEAQRVAALSEHQARVRFLRSVSDNLEAPMRWIEQLNKNLSDDPVEAADQMQKMHAAVLDMDALLTQILEDSTHSLGREASPPGGSAAALPGSFASAEEAPPLHGQLVLLVDDDPLALRGMQTLLHGLGGEVLCASSCDEALKIVDNHLRTPDLMVSDHRLGGNLTGLQTIQAVRSHIADDIPAWLISADLNLPEAQARSCGIQVLRKPVRAEVLAQAMRHAMAGQRPT